jgi:hypothetical protein
MNFAIKMPAENKAGCAKERQINIGMGTDWVY